ncbi:MAG: hypothetical protein CBC35_00715 [Planctomycetes bacterium TMED75]|nr:hypothetical protein [Planctomycetaceae bacterium]OUU96686.1 MAG: hypothetical protein CBC35_00715 [Planctomycetes bacterium TMED75]
MGELIFVLVIVVQGIAGIAAAINKKKRDREKKAAKDAGLEASASAKGDGRNIPEAPTSGFAARLKKASSTDTPSGPEVTAFSPGRSHEAMTEVSSKKSAVQKRGSEKPSQGGAFDERLARRRAQIEQLRAMASKAIASTSAAPPAAPPPAAPPPSQRTSAAATATVRRTASPSRSTTPAPARPIAAKKAASTTRETRATRQSRAARPPVAKEASLLGGSTKKRSSTPPAAQQLRRLLSKSSEVQRAIILKELLDPPVALRPEYDRAV